MKQNFEEFIRQSVERQEELDYNPAHWDRIEKELDSSKKSNLKYYVGGALLAGTLVTAYLLTGSPAAETQTSSQPSNAVTTEKTTTIATPGTPKEKTNTISTSSTSDIEKIQSNKLEPVSMPSATPALILPPAQNKNVAPTPTVVTKKVVDGNITASIKVNKTNGCEGEAFYFTADVNVPATYQWTFGDGKSSELPNPMHSYAQSGKYGVNLKVTSLIDGKTIRIPEGTLMVVNTKPNAKFRYNVDEGSNFSRVVELSNTTVNTIGSQWVVDGKFYNEEEPRVKINRKGTYPVSLIVKNDLGCYDTCVQNVIVDKEYNLLAPAAFTPNDDNTNDDFIPEAIRNTDVGFKMDIIDPKTGGVIFSSTKQAWDGMNSSTGRKADFGTYLWIVTLTRSDNSKEVFKGNISIVK